jgi:hypothetical protein
MVSERFLPRYGQFPSSQLRAAFNRQVEGL